MICSEQIMANCVVKANPKNPPHFLTLICVQLQQYHRVHIETSSHSLSEDKIKKLNDFLPKSNCRNKMECDISVHLKWCGEIEIAEMSIGEASIIYGFEIFQYLANFYQFYDFGESITFEDTINKKEYLQRKLSECKYIGGTKANIIDFYLLSHFLYEPLDQQDAEIKNWIQRCIISKCPCSRNNHLGISTFEVNSISNRTVDSNVSPIVKKFFMGNGIEINDIEEAKDILLNRDHQDILSLRTKYQKGKLRVKMVPPIFFSEYPDVLKPEDYEVKKGREKPGKLVGEMAEKEVFDRLKSYYEKSGSDVVILHSHKFLTEVETREKDFIIINLSLGYIMQLEVKANVKNYQSSIKQFIDGKQKLNTVLNSIKIDQSGWRYIGVFYAQKGSDFPLFNCKPCLDFAIIGLHNLELKLEEIEAKIQNLTPEWNPAERIEDFIQLLKELMYMTQGHIEAPVTKSNLLKNVVKSIDKSGTVENILFWTPQQLSVIHAMNEPFMIFHSFYGTGKTLLLKERAKYLLKKYPGQIIYFYVQEAFNLSASMYPDNELFPGSVLQGVDC